MNLRRLAVLGVIAAACIAALVAPVSAGAAWHYNFKHFIKVSKTAASSGTTFVTRCAPGLAGDWQLTARILVEVRSSLPPKNQDLELEVLAKMPITTEFREVHDVDVRWTANLPKDPSAAALLSKHYERLAQGQSDFYDGMSVRWRPEKQVLDIRHHGLYYNGTQVLAPGKATTPFKPKPGC